MVVSVYLSRELTAHQGTSLQALRGRQQDLGSFSPVASFLYFKITKMIHQHQMWVQRSQVQCGFAMGFCSRARLVQNGARLQNTQD